MVTVWGTPRRPAHLEVACTGTLGRVQSEVLPEFLAVAECVLRVPFKCKKPEVERTQWCGGSNGVVAVWSPPSPFYIILDENQT